MKVAVRRGLPRARRLGMLRRLCADVPQLLHRYDLRFELCDCHEAKAHWIVYNSGEPELLPRSRWSGMRGSVMNCWASETWDGGSPCALPHHTAEGGKEMLVQVGCASVVCAALRSGALEAPS